MNDNAYQDLVVHIQWSVTIDYQIKPNFMYGSRLHDTSGEQLVECSSRGRVSSLYTVHLVNYQFKIRPCNTCQIQKVKCPLSDCGYLSEASINLLRSSRILWANTPYDPSEHC